MDHRKRIAIIGAGMAGLTAARHLITAGHHVSLFDKGRKPGGRLSTRRNAFASFNHGCQYFTARDAGFLAAMQAAGAQPWPAAGARRFIGKPDMAALPEALAAGVNLRLNSQVTGIDQTIHGWSLTVGGHTQKFDTLILAIPAPQAAALLAPTNHPFLARLANVHLAPCWAAMLGFTGEIPGPDTARAETGPLAWIARENSRPGHAATPTAYTLHATPDWSTTHLEDTAEIILPALIAAFVAATGISATPVHAVAHRWRYALADQPLGEPCLWDSAARLGLAGDWCLDGKLEAAYLSGKTLAETMA